MTEDDPKELFRRGMGFLKRGDIEQATRLFEKAYHVDKENPAFMSYYGVCSALRWGKIGLGLELCTKAIKKEFFKADYYINLSKVYLAADNKSGAITALKKGLRFEPENNEIHELLIDLGVRKRQVIPFLRRNNPINRYLGVFFRRTIPHILRRKGPEKEDDADIGV